MLLELPIMLLSLLCSNLCFWFLKTSSYLTRPNNTLTVLLEYIDLSIWVPTYKTSIHHIDRRNTIQCIGTISSKTWIILLPYIQVITIQALGRDYTICIKIFTYYAGIILDAFLYLLCWKLCWHNWLRPTTRPNKVWWSKLVAASNSTLTIRRYKRIKCPWLLDVGLTFQN